MNLYIVSLHRHSTRTRYFLHLGAPYKVDRICVIDKQDLEISKSTPGSELVSAPKIVLNEFEVLEASSIFMHLTESNEIHNTRKYDLENLKSATRLEPAIRIRAILRITF